MDNDPSQRSKAARKAINNSGATLFEIPPRSPDLIPIENLFHIVKKYWTGKPSRRDTITEIPIDLINNLLLSMPKRIETVIKYKELRTK